MFHDIRSTDTNHSLFLSALVLNCQSIVPKKESFINLLDVYHPDVVIGCESWLKPYVVSSEVFPSGYKIYRKDHVDGYSSVFITCGDILTSSELTFTNSSSELVACKDILQTAPHLLHVQSTILLPAMNPIWKI